MTSCEKGLFVTRTISGIDLQLSYTTGILQKENVWFVDVEVQHETRFPFFLLNAVNVVVWHVTSPVSYAIP